MATLILHIGMPKTGSTSIQEAFDRERAGLLAAGFNYLDLGPSHSKVFVALFSMKKPRLRDRVTRHLDEAVEDGVGYDLADLERLLLDKMTGPGAPVTIASGEMLFQFGEAKCRALHALVAPHFERIRVLAYVRDPIGLANSRAQQNVKGGRDTLAAMSSPKAIAKGTSPLVPHYRKWLEAWRGVFGAGAVEIREFAPDAFVGGDLVTDFATAVGVPAPLQGALAGAWAKPARNAETVFILDRYLARTREGDRPRFGPLRDLVWDLPGSSFSLPRETLAAVWRAAEPDLRWLEGVMGRPVFTERYPPAADTGPAWGEETLVALAALLGRPVEAPNRGSPAERERALERLARDLEAKVSDARISKKYARGRMSRFAGSVRAAAGSLLHRLRRRLGGTKAKKRAKR